MDAVTAAGTGASGLATRGARWALVFVWVTGLVRGWIDGFDTATPAALAASYGIALVGALLLTSRGDRPLRPELALGVLTSALLVTVLVLLQAGTAGEVWLFNFASYLLALLIARGNPRHGLGGGAVQIVGATVWGLVGSQPPAGVAGMVAVPLMALAVGVIWRAVLTRVVSREREHRSAAAAADRDARAARYALESYDQELESVRREVDPLLRRVAAGEVLTPAFRTQLAASEGVIRDRIRSPQLQHPTLAAAAARARSWGATVTMFAESADPAGVIDDATAANVATIIDEGVGTAVVIRARSSTDSTEISVVITDTRGVRRHTFVDGRELPGMD